MPLDSITLYARSNAAALETDFRTGREQSNRQFSHVVFDECAALLPVVHMLLTKSLVAELHRVEIMPVALLRSRHGKSGHVALHDATDLTLSGLSPRSR